MKRMVFLCSILRRSRASSTIFLKSATPALTALTGLKWEEVMFAMIFASVVLPLPGGPQSINEGIWPLSINWRKACPLPTICSCPTNSSNVRGRIRAARGASFSISFFIRRSNKSSGIILFRHCECIPRKNRDLTGLTSLSWYPYLLRRDNFRPARQHQRL